jgi:hypothetical protein
VQLRFVPALALIAFPFSPSGVRAERRVTVSKSGDRFLVEAASSVAAPAGIAWRVLTGHETYPSLLEIEEIPHREIRCRAFGGNVKTLNTQIVISAVNGDTLVRYRSESKPDFWVPPLISPAILRTSIRGKLQAVEDEIERRAAAKSGAP